MYTQVMTYKVYFLLLVTVGKVYFLLYTLYFFTVLYTFLLLIYFLPRYMRYMTYMKIRRVRKNAAQDLPRPIFTVDLDCEVYFGPKARVH